MIFPLTIWTERNTTKQTKKQIPLFLITNSLHFVPAPPWDIQFNTQCTCYTLIMLCPTALAYKRFDYKKKQIEIQK